MWTFKVSMQARNKGYCVRSIINYTKANTIDDLYVMQNKLKSKLEMIIPRSSKPKFVCSLDGLVVTIDLEKAHLAGRLTHEMEDYIKSAIITL